MLTAPQFSPANLAAFRERMARAAHAAGRAPESVTPVGVTKTQPPPVIVAARAAGLADFAENHLQEALPELACVPRAGRPWPHIRPPHGNNNPAGARAGG